MVKSEHLNCCGLTDMLDKCALLQHYHEPQLSKAPAPVLDGWYCAQQN